MRLRQGVFSCFGDVTSLGQPSRGEILLGLGSEGVKLEQKSTGSVNRQHELGNDEKTPRSNVSR